MRYRFLGWLVLAWLLAGTLPAWAASFTLGWDTPLDTLGGPDATITGYRLYLGLRSNSFTWVRALGLVNQTTVADASPGETYTARIVGIHADGSESLFSNEVVLTVPSSSAPGRALLVENALLTQDLRAPGIADISDALLRVRGVHDVVVRGALVYLPTNATAGARGLTAVDAGAVATGQTRRVTLSSVGSVAASSPAFNNLIAFQLAQLPGTGSVLTALVGVSGVQGTCATGSWASCANIAWGTTMTAALGATSPWTALPDLCTQVVNGSSTSQPLWPWPMNNRITAAYQQSGRGAINVQNEVISLLGPLPASCQTGGIVRVATSLRFVSQPTDTAPAATITPPVTVEVLDQDGLHFDVGGVAITVGLVSGSGLSGTLTATTANNGVATFANLAVATAQTGLQLRATSGTLTPATSQAFTITATPPPIGTRLLWAMQEGSGTTLADTGDAAIYTGTFAAAGQAPTWVTGHAAGQQGLHFVAASQQSVANASFPWAANEAVTVLLWVKKGTCTAGCGLLHVGATGVPTQAFGAYLAFGSNQIIWNYGDITTGNSPVWTWVPALENQWVRLGLVASGPQGSEKSIYINGQRVANIPSGGAPSIALTGVTLGLHGPSSPSVWGNMEVEGLTILNRFSTPTQMLTDYTQATPPPPLTGSPSSMLMGR